MVSMLRKFSCTVQWAAITTVAMWAGAAQAAPKTHSPTTSTALSSLLNTKSGPAGALELGDTIVLQANTTYTGTFILPKVDVGSGWITIQSSAIASLPAAGVRVNLSHAANMPKIRPTNGSAAPAIKTATSAHHLKLIGVEIIAPSDNSRIYSLVELGSGGWTAGGELPQSTVAEVPQYLTIDRCIIRAHSDTQDVRRGIALNSGNTDIINSHISNIKENGNQSQGIGGWNGTGNYNVVNNYIECAGINFIIGGATALIPGIPEHITFRRNHCYKKNQWRWGHPEYLGINFGVVTHFEIKFGRYFDVDGNIFENTWNHIQSQSVIFKVDSQTTSATDPVYAAKMKSEDIVFTKNIVRSAPTAFVLQGRDWNPAPGQPPQLRRLQIRDNLAYDISRTSYGISQLGTTGGRFVSQSGGGDQITIENNTCFHDRNTLLVDSPEYPMADFIFRNNISQAFGNFTGGDAWQNAHINGPGGGYLGTGSLNQVAPGAIFAKNIIAGMNSTMISSYSTAHQSANWLSVPANFSGVLVNYNNGVGSAPFAGWKVVGWDQPTNASLYPYNNTGTNGKDIGCDIDAVVAATQGCISGIWPGGGSGTTTVTLKNGLNGYNGATSVHVSGQLPTQNTGPSSYYHVTSNLAATNGFMYRSFYKFDVSSAASGIPAGATITSARLKLLVEPSSSTTGYGVSVYRVAPVTGFTVNYATATKNTYNGTNSWTGGANAGGDVADSNNDFIDTAVDNISLVPIGSWLDFNVTSAVQAWVNGTANNGLIVRPNNGANTISLRMSTASDLHGLAERATLEVTYETAPPSTTKLLKNGLDGYTGGTSVHVSGQLPTSNTGPASYYHVTSSLAATNGFMYRAFYKFDVSTAASGIPAGATIESARLKVKVEPSSSTSGYGVSVYRVAPVNNAFTVSYATATKNTYNGTNAWTGGANAGGDVADSNNDFIDTPVDNIPLVAIGSWLDFNVTSAVQAWVNGTPNNGLIIRPNSGANTIGLRLSTPSDLHGSAEYVTLEVTYH